MRRGINKLNDANATRKVGQMGFNNGERAFVNILSETTCSSEYQCNHF